MAVLLLFVTPALMTVGAAPISANLSWNPDQIPLGTTTMATFGVADTLPGGGSDPDCPAGDTFSGTLTVTTPHGLTSFVTESNVPCGTMNLTAVYPTDFTAGTGAPNTDEIFQYSATWAGTTSAVVGGTHPTFNVMATFVVYCCGPPPPPVPEFGAPAMVVAAICLVLVAVMRKGKLLKV